MPYPLEALFASFRILLWFILLFRFIAPLFLDYTRTLQGIEKLVYSWVGLGGVIIFAVFVLTVLHIYDFFSLLLTLLLIPVIQSIWRSNKSLVHYFKDFEIRTIVRHVRFIEKPSGLNLYRWKEKLKKPGVKFSHSILVLSIALTGGIIRMVPALTNAAPLSRTWYFELSRIKNIQLQDYFSGSSEPSGMHALITVFNMLTQVSPEMILHLLGALISVLLCILIYWAISEITKYEVPFAPILGMSIFALTPLLLMPFLLESQTLANAMDLALCFAIPTVIIFLRSLRNPDNSQWFYVVSGFIATGMTNLFAAIIILLPLLIISFLCLSPRIKSAASFKQLSYLLIPPIVILAPILLYNFLYNIDQHSFFTEQMFSTRVFTYNPLLIMPIEKLSVLYLAVAGFLAVGYAVEFVIDKREKIRDELVLLLVFAMVALCYASLVDTISSWVDLEQLQNFYCVLIAIFVGVVFATVLRWTNKLLKMGGKAFSFTNLIVCTLIIGGFIYLQNGIQVSRQLPSTIPNGFQKAYYKIIDSSLPYSYAVVAPEINRITAKNRHYFMNYDYFLSEYGKIDSLYHQQLLVPEAKRTITEVPPASIFVFTEKQPYKAIQQGILYNSPVVMQKVEKWIALYKQDEGRRVKTYYEDDQSIVYQIINRENETQIKDILSSINPKKK